MTQKQKKILVCEFITGGGLSDAALPESLIQDGTLMRDCLLRDLAECSQYQLIGMHDARLPPAALFAQSVAVAPQQFEACFKQLLAEVDYVWLIAPETDGTLLHLSELCYAVEAQPEGARFLGSGFDTMLIGTSKSLCFEALQSAKVHTLPVHAGEDLIRPDYFTTCQQSHEGAWVAKPEDGAGCEGVRLFETLPALQAWITQDNRYLNYLAQPYQAGLAASISMLCRNGKAWVLSCNQQHIQVLEGQFKLTGVTVNHLVAYRQRFETIARKIAHMLPDALGYLGVDVVIDTANDKIYVIEINPRLTTSYAGLREVLGDNPAKLILDCVLNDQFEMPKTFSKPNQQQVEIAL